MEKSTLFTSLVLVTIVFGNCKKSTANDDKEATNTELITSSTWKFDKASIDTNKDGVADAPVPSIYLTSCQTDNLLTLRSDGSGTLDEGATKCDADDPQSNAFTWTFKNNETIVNIPTAIVTGIDGDVKVTTLTDSKLVLQKEVTYVGLPQSVNVILELKH